LKFDPKPTWVEIRASRGADAGKGGRSRPDSDTREPTVKEPNFSKEPTPTRPAKEATAMKAAKAPKTGTNAAQRRPPMKTMAASTVAAGGSVDAPEKA
jgi:hypothetical protein